VYFWQSLSLDQTTSTANEHARPAKNPPGAKDSNRFVGDLGLRGHTPP
jgi:hypothetical protein